MHHYEAWFPNLELHPSDINPLHGSNHNSALPLSLGQLAHMRRFVVFTRERRAICLGWFTSPLSSWYYWWTSPSTTSFCSSLNCINLCELCQEGSRVHRPIPKTMSGNKWLLNSLLIVQKVLLNKVLFKESVGTQRFFNTSNVLIQFL